jgi:membrane-associated protease RseP (regulator of RpoE activity)
MNARRGIVLCSLVALLGSPGCKKKAEVGKGAGAAAPATVAPAAPLAPAFDRAGAEKALVEHVWQGVHAGKPAKLYVIPARKGMLVGVLRLGSQDLMGRFSLDANGSIRLASRPKPTAQGLETTTFAGKLAPDFSKIAGTAEREAKQGFVSQSFGLGDFSLTKGPLLEGAPIFFVPKGSLNDALGMKVGDMLLELDGQKVRNGAFPDLSKKAVGAKVSAAVIRDGERIALKGKVPAPRAPRPPKTK